jgi:hypothetical protein
MKSYLKCAVIASSIVWIACGPTYVQPVQSYQQQQQPVYDPGYDPNQIVYDPTPPVVVVVGGNRGYYYNHIFMPLISLGGVDGFYDSGHHFHTSVTNKTTVVNNYNIAVKSHTTNNNVNKPNFTSTTNGNTVVKPNYNDSIYKRGAGSSQRGVSGAPVVTPNPPPPAPNSSVGQRFGRPSGNAPVAPARPAAAPTPSSRPSYSSGSSSRSSGSSSRSRK